MKKLFLILFVFSPLYNYAQPVKFSIKDFTIELSSLLTPQNQIWVSSGYTTVHPAEKKIFGVSGMYSPPFACSDLEFELDLKINNHPVPDAGSYGKNDVGLLYAGGIWQPDRIIRKGTYHMYSGNQLLSLSVKSELIPLFEKSGFLLKIIATNNSGITEEVKFIPKFKAGLPATVKLSSWGFSPPFYVHGGACKDAGKNKWINDQAIVQLNSSDSIMNLKPGQTQIIYFAINITAADAPPLKITNFEQEEINTQTAWKNRINKYTGSIPVIETDIPGLKDYYMRSLLNGLLCIWENPAFKLNPHLAEAGIDGGAMCTYLWDVGGYISKMITLMMGEYTKNITMAYKNVDLSKYYAYSLDGTGVGVYYSYNTIAFTSLFSSYYSCYGFNSEFYNEAKRLLQLDESKRKNREVLIDYGVQHNLLEMRSAGWEHYVASPNAERVVSLRLMAAIAEKEGIDKTESAYWRKLADTISNEIRLKLWDEKNKWFKCIYPDGHEEIIYSIQVFDVIRSGLMTDNMITSVLSTLKENYFLGSCGVSSVSKSDSVHYEELDTDWSGGGAYTGDGPQLAEDLFSIGQSELAWNVLKRHFWMGKYLAYYPQEHLYNRPEVPAHKRANCIAGLTGAQTIIFSMIGFEPRIDGSLWINPHPVNEGTIKLNDIKFRGKSFSVELNKTQMIVISDGKQLYKGKPDKIKLI